MCVTKYGWCQKAVTDHTAELRSSSYKRLTTMKQGHRPKIMPPRTSLNDTPQLQGCSEGSEVHRARWLTLQVQLLTHWPSALPCNPSAHQHDVLCALHGDPTAGCWDFTKSYEQVRHRYFWPRPYASVLEYTNSWQPC